MDTKSYNSSTKSPIIQEIIMSNRIGAISIILSKLLNIPPLKALKMFYSSNACINLHNKSTGLYLYGDLYIAEDFINEINSNNIT